jgi:hypothetical protein
MANTTFSQMKSARKSSFNKLNDELNKMQSGGAQQSGPDTRFWQPTVDKFGNGQAVLRFLPAPKDEDVPFVRIFSHGFKGPSGSWYIENSRTTIGESDPVAELNGKLWNSGVEADKETARQQKRRLHFISNILVIKDPANPENEGKVFLFKYGKKIFDKLNDLMNPAFDDEEPVNPFDFWEGANFRLRIRQVEGYRNYDKSDFSEPSPLSDDDAMLEKIWEKQYSLQEFIDPKNFKSYDELKTKLDRVLGTSATQTAPKVSNIPQQPAPEMKTKASSMDDDDEDFDSLLKSLSEE